MNNGNNSPQIEPNIKQVYSLLVEIAEELDLIEHAVLMQSVAIIDLSDRSGRDKQKLQKKFLAAVSTLHRKSWKKRAKLLRKFH
jgi:hypothetical protein